MYDPDYTYEDKDKGVKVTRKFTDKEVGAVCVFIAFFFLPEICGLIGVCGQVMCCQVTYTLLMSITIVLLNPYVIVPIVVTFGMCNGWHLPPQQNPA